MSEAIHYRAKLVRAKHNLDIFQFYLLMSDSIQMLF